MALNQPNRLVRKPHQRAAAIRYKVTISGTYFTKTANIEKPYEVTVTMEQQHIEAGALMTFKNHIAPTKMVQLYADYSGLATHHVLNCVREDDPNAPPASLSVMNQAQLLEYIYENEYPIVLYLYKDTDALRQAVMDYEAEPEAFLENQDALDAKRGALFAAEQSVLALNQTITKSGDAQDQPGTPEPPQERLSEPLAQPAKISDEQAEKTPPDLTKPEPKPSDKKDKKDSKQADIGQI